MPTCHLRLETDMNSTFTIKQFANYKRLSKKITCLTAYDASFARVLSEAGIDILLVGDSLGNVIQGANNTIPVMIDDMVYHTRCVAHGNAQSLILSDLPFMTYATPQLAMQNAGALMQAGAHMVKLEGGAWLCDTVAMLTERGIPVCGHLGLLPQSVYKYGGYRKHGKATAEAELILNDAHSLQQAGASLLVLECIPEGLAKSISEALTIPTIGIGSGPHCDGQVLVLYDILGLSASAPKFAPNLLANQQASIADVIQQYIALVTEKEVAVTD